MSAKIHDKPIRPGGECGRGSSKDRRNRRNKLLKVYGDSTFAPCIHCGTEVTYETLEVDKIIPGSMGGRYNWANIHVSCKPCNRTRSDDTTPEEIAKLQALVIQ
jgi:5-methylcytosine-specific restriction endonuclease McrA